MPTRISIDDARAHLLALALEIREHQRLSPSSPRVQQVTLDQALGRVLASDVLCHRDVPAHDNAAMDGFAFAFDPSFTHKDSSTDSTHELLIVGKALAGMPYTGRVEPGQCVQVTTGAVLPPCVDTVIPLERVHASATHIFFPANGLHKGAHRRLRGEDLAQGTVALPAGTRLHSASLGLLASLGIAQVAVHARLRVAYGSTGNEVLPVGQPSRAGVVYDANRYSLFGMLTKLGCESVNLNIVGDDPKQLASTFLAACETADVVITTGGVSTGEADHTRAALEQLGEMTFWQIDMRPGRPMAVGSRRRADGSRVLLCGLPGNPVAAMVTFLALVRPCLQRLMGQAAVPPLRLPVRTCTAIRKKAGRTEYQRGLVRSAEDGSLWVTVDAHQGSGILSTMTRANALVVLGPELSDVKAGATVFVMLLEALI